MSCLGYERFGIEFHVDLVDHVVDEPAGSLNDERGALSSDFGKPTVVNSPMDQHLIDPGCHIERAPLVLGKETRSRIVVSGVETRMVPVGVLTLE